MAALALSRTVSEVRRLIGLCRLSVYFLCGYMRVWTRQTAVGAIPVHLLRPLPYILARNPTRNVQLNSQKSNPSE